MPKQAVFEDELDRIKGLTEENRDLIRLSLRKSLIPLKQELLCLDHIRQFGECSDKCANKGSYVSWKNLKVALGKRVIE